MKLKSYIVVNNVNTNYHFLSMCCVTDMELEIAHMGISLLDYLEKTNKQAQKPIAWPGRDEVTECIEMILAKSSMQLAAVSERTMQSNPIHCV